MAQPGSSEQQTHKDEQDTKSKNEKIEGGTSSSSSLVDSGSFLDDFRKCIEGFDPADAAVLKLQAAQQATTEATDELPKGSTNGHKGTQFGHMPKVLEYLKLKENGLKEDGKKFVSRMGPVDDDDDDEAAMFKEVTRYNIVDGTIMHCRELERQAGEGSQDGDDDSEDRLYDEETGSMSSPSQPMEEESGENFYPCKVCKKRYISKSSLRKHICRAGPEAGKGQPAEEMKTDDEAIVQLHHPIPLQIPIPIPIDLRRDTESNDSEVLDMRYHIPMAQSLGNGHIISPVTGSMLPTNGEFYTLTGEALVINENGNLVPEIHACPICNMTFQHASQLMRHRRTHSNERPFECAECHQAFRRKCHLKRHWQRIHSGEKPFKCGICGKAFSDRDHQRQHETIHGPETYPCLKCRSVFPTEAYLVAHVAEHPDCKAAFAKGEDGSPKRVRGKRKGTPGSYRCGLCGDFFKKLRQIQTHQRVRHHDVFEKKYKCNICGKGFDLISDLTHHRHTHAARGSKYDVDKESERPTMLKQMLTNAAEKNSQNKQELMGMLQLLERRIQQQQKQVRKMEDQQDRISQELVDSTTTVATNNNSMAESILNNSKLRTLLERRPLSELPVLKRECDLQQGGPDPKMLRTNRMVLDLSNPKSPKTPTSLSSQPRSSNPGKSDVTFIGEQAPEEANLLQSSAIMDLMTGNRHKCEECGLSFLLYSDFRTHRKRHERARLAMGKEDGGGGTATDIVCGNPEGDRSLCRDCCNQNDSSGTKPTMTVHHKHDEDNGRHTNKIGHKIWNGKHSSTSRFCERKSEDGKDCTQCSLLRDQLSKEREEKGVLREEVDRLREALVNFAKMASTHPTLGANIGQELTALFNRTVTIKQEIQELV
nr:zinc finger protein 629-like [Lytechinus pictus]